MKFYIKYIVALLFLIININAQVVTNTAVLHSTVTQSDNSTIPVSIPVEIVRTNGRIAELRLNISNVAANAKFVNLRVYELIYTTNVIETPIADSTTTGGSNTGGTTGNTNTGGTTNTGGGTTDPTNTGGTTGGGTTTPTTPTTVTNNVTLAVTIKKVDNTEQNVNLPAQTIWSNNQLENIVFDITSLPVDAIIIRYRILDYIYDPNGNLIGP